MAEFAYEPGPEVQLAAGESAKEISGRSPWRLAGRRLLRNRLAMASLGLFVLIVVVSLLAPFYANHIAKTDPFSSNLTGTTNVNGKEVEVVQETQGGLGLGVDPDRADLAVELLHRRRQPGPRRDGAGALRRPRLAADRRRLRGHLHAARPRPRAPGGLLPRLDRLRPLPHHGPDLGVPRLPARDLVGDGPADQAGRPEMGPGDDRPVEPLGADLDHRDRLHPLRLSPATRPGAVGAREGVRRGRRSRRAPRTCA